MALTRCGVALEPVDAVLQREVCNACCKVEESLVSELGVERFPEEILELMRARIDAELVERRTQEFCRADPFGSFERLWSALKKQGAAERSSHIEGDGDAQNVDVMENRDWVKLFQLDKMLCVESFILDEARGVSEAVVLKGQEMGTIGRKRQRNVRETLKVRCIKSAPESRAVLNISLCKGSQVEELLHVELNFVCGTHGWEGCDFASASQTFCSECGPENNTMADMDVRVGDLTDFVAWFAPNTLMQAWSDGEFQDWLLAAISMAPCFDESVKLKTAELFAIMSCDDSDGDDRGEGAVDTEHEENKEHNGSDTGETQRLNAQQRKRRRCT